MDGAHALPLEAALEAEIELGRVDADEQRSPRCAQPAIHVAPDAHELGQMPDHFNDAAHREAFLRMPRLAASAFHARTRNAGEAHAGNAFAHCGDQLRAERVARRLAGDDADGGRGCIHQRTMPRPAVSRNAASGASTAADFASAAMRARAASSESSERYSVL